MAPLGAYRHQWMAVARTKKHGKVLAKALTARKFP